MSSKLLINVNDATPTVVPDTDADTNVPDTGVFSTIHNDGVNNTSNMITPIIGISVLALALIALIISLVKKHKSKKTNKFSIYSKGHTILRITGIMTLILITTFVALNYNVKQEDNVSAANNTLTVTTSDIEIDVDLNDKPVFATGESTVTVDSATTAGYTLMAYVDSTTTNLTNETNASSTSTISMLESTHSQALTDNTWGMAITKPTSQDDTVFRGLPTTEKEAMTIKVASDATTANDKTTIYYSTYITPDLDFGAYSGATITYIAVANMVEDDVTVNYHMPGDVGGNTRDSADFVNTVAYNKSQELAYMGDNCGTSYVGTEPAAIVKTNNLNNDGVQNGGYSPVMEPIEIDGDMAFVVAFDTVKAQGADGVKVNINYKITNAYIAIFKGEWGADEIIDDDNKYGINPAALEESQLMLSFFDGPHMEGRKEYSFDGDTVTIAAIVFNEPDEDYDYGLYAKVFPIFAEQPENTIVAEETTCYSLKSSEMESKWDKLTQRIFSDEVYYYSSQVFAPGSEKIKMEIDYELSPGMMLMIANGNTGAVSLMLGMESVSGNRTSTILPFTVLTALKGVTAGSKEVYLDGGSVTFVLLDDESFVEGRDFTFDAKFYPVYDNEHENTTPVNMSTIVGKTGSYREHAQHLFWSADEIPFPNEKNVKMFIDLYYDEFAGRTIDLYESIVKDNL